MNQNSPTWRHWEIVDNVDENGKLNPKTLEKILAITSKI